MSARGKRQTPCFRFIYWATSKLTIVTGGNGSFLPTDQSQISNRQITLGKQFAGLQVLVEEQEAGVWLIRTATVIPENERWLHEAQATSDLARATSWSKQHPASDSQTDTVLAAVAQSK